MEKHRIKELQKKEKLTFSRSQAYLILGCILAIAVLAFSLGHLITRGKEEKTVNIPARSARVKNPAIPEADVLDEMDRLEKRLIEAEQSLKDEDTAAFEELPVPEENAERVQVVEITVPETPAKKESTTPSKKKPEPAGGTRTTEPKIKTIKNVKESRADVSLNKDIDLAADKSSLQASHEKPAKSEPAREAKPLKTEAVSEPAAPSEPVAADFRPKEKKTAAPEETPPVKPVVIINPKFTVQVASFATKSKADDLKLRLTKKGYRVHLLRQKRSRILWYQVRVGEFEKRADAKKMAKRLEQYEKLDTDIKKYKRP